MITAVDTNILVDILEPDPVFGHLSRDALSQCRQDGVIAACPVVFAEVASSNGVAIRELMAALDSAGLTFDPLTEASTVEAASAWRRYRGRILGRDRIAADFLIGAHAKVQCDRLLTRDRGFYQEYFHGLDVLDPSAGR